MKQRGRDKFNKYKKGIKFLVKITGYLPKTIQLKIFKWNINTQGKLGIVIRYIFLCNICKYCGDNVSVHPGVHMFNLHNIEIGNNVSIHPMCYIDGKGGIIIGNDVSIAHGTSILTTEHIYRNLETNIKDQGLIEKCTVIKDNVWLGSGVKILAGSTIREGVIIAAGAVVNGDTVCNTIYGGIPYRQIKER